MTGMQDDRPGVLELFAGIGSVARGFADTERFRILGLTDIDSDARDAVVSNDADVSYLRADIRSVGSGQLRELGNGDAIQGILGCPPCQGFSAAGHRRDDDERNSLLGVYFDTIAALEPQFFVMENVPAVLWKEELHHAIDRLADKYSVWSGILNSALYGLPQTRQRAIVIGYHRDLNVIPAPPAPTHAGTRQVFDYLTAERVSPGPNTLGSLLGHYPITGVARGLVRQARLLPDRPLNDLYDFVTVEDAIADLPHDFGSRYAAAATSEYARGLRGDADQLVNHTGWKHRPELVSRLSRVPEGGVPGEKTGRNAVYFSQAYGRLHGSGLARTVTTNFHNPGSGRFTHHRAHRTLTIREAARLQGIPDSFQFAGHLSVQERLIGNAFPRPWARAIASQVDRQIGHLLV